jgi:hypothetical protein
MSRVLLASVLAVIVGALSSAADPVPTALSPKTVMLTPGKVLLDDPLAAAPGKDWKLGKGKWEAVDGAVRGAEVKADMHGAVMRRNLEMKDVVIAYSFKLDGAKVTTLSLNGAKGHISRVRITPTGVSVQKDDQDGKDGPDKAAVLDTATVEVKAGEWHTLAVELRGPDILATLDGKYTAFGTHDAINTTKTNLGLTVAGETASFKSLKVYEAKETVKDWDATRAKLLAERKK